MSLIDQLRPHSQPARLPHTHHRLEITVLLKKNCDKHANQSRLDEKPQLGGKSQKVKSELAQLLTFNFAHLQMSGFRITGEYTVCTASGPLTSLRPYTDHTHTHSHQGVSLKLSVYITIKAPVSVLHDVHHYKDFKDQEHQRVSPL